MNRKSSVFETQMALVSVSSKFFIQIASETQISLNKFAENSDSVEYR